jgi:hypothetical protein
VAPKIFISHSTTDFAFVETDILRLLRQHGIEYWYAPTDIRTADEWMRSILGGLNSCDWFLVVLTPSAVASEWVQAEVMWAFEKRKQRVVPVMLETCNPADLHLKLLRIQYVDFRHDRQTAKRRLLQIWDIHHDDNNAKKRMRRAFVKRIGSESEATSTIFAESGRGHRLELSWDLLQAIALRPRQFQGTLLDVCAILAADMSDLNEITRRALGLPTEFRTRSVIDAFVDLDGKGVFKRIPNRDYHVHILLSDAVLPSLNSKLYTGVQWEPFSYKDITDENVINEYAMRLETRFVGYVKVHRSLAAKGPGLFVDLLRVAQRSQDWRSHSVDIEDVSHIPATSE